MDSRRRRQPTSEDDGTVFSLRLYPADRDNVNTILRHLINMHTRGPLPNATTAIRFALASVAGKVHTGEWKEEHEEEQA